MDDGRLYGLHPYEIQAQDMIEELEDGTETPYLEGRDPEAQALVVRKAAEGSPVHVKAVNFMRRYSPGEYADLQRVAGELGVELPAE
jgi:hypothetical protein